MFDDITDLFPLICGVYILYWEDEIVYVGQSQDVCRRVQEHHQGWMAFDKVMVKRCEPIELSALEFRLIRKHCPRHNKVYKQPQPIEAFDPDNYPPVYVKRSV